jgi:hypothetical protein
MATAGVDTTPFRSEVFTTEQLVVHARAMAGRHKLAARRGRDRLLARLDENEETLVRINQLVAGALAKGRAAGPAAESLLANSYLIHEQIRTARRHLPKRFSRQLPQLSTGPAAGYPRVYPIDALPQSWAVISGAADPGRQRAAMDAVDRRLVRRDARLVQLLAPPFDQSALNPGYVKGYVPGARENGGQYTHAAVWTTMAFALLGDSRRVWELFALINPLNHGGTAEGIARYKVEPYVVAADVHAVPPHVGRGGWTWYTGSAGWMYRLILEVLLGLTREADRLRFSPHLPDAWPGFTVRYRYGETVYHIAVARVPAERAQVELDGIEQPDASVPLTDDRAAHRVRIELPAPAAT